MQLESIKVFCDVVRWASFSRGAAENQISQSSASQVVHQLEVRLGVKLIDRSKRPLVLTPHGKVYYEGCKELVGRYLEIENRVKALEDDHNLVGTVRLASIYSIGLHHMSQYVRTFGELYPGANVQLEYLHPTRVVESVLAEEVELGLISFPRKWTDLTVTPWREEEMVLAVHPSHRFAGLTSVAVADLDGETFVGFDADLAIRRAIDRFLRHHNVQVRVAVEFDNIENIKRAVEIPAGVAILPVPTLAREVAAGSLAAVRLDGQDPSHRLTRPLAIIRRRSHQLSLTASRFLKLLTATEECVPAAAGASSAERVDAKS
ncbi:LysR substrate-binding domain-containing protein [Singulisphaera sp. Ch08]|uniref:LysR substrate-binding domain-containing protein n=1 Tax=Singulisphaera sp. Ch08 TaxID=3120278 RepID=A0AAU7CNA5_9BACT